MKRKPCYLLIIYPFVLSTSVLVQFEKPCFPELMEHLHNVLTPWSTTGSSSFTNRDWAENKKKRNHGETRLACSTSTLYQCENHHQCHTQQNNHLQPSRHILLDILVEMRDHLGYRKEYGGGFPGGQDILPWPEGRCFRKGGRLGQY